jgi:hypothetical protein
MTEIPKFDLPLVPCIDNPEPQVIRCCEHQLLNADPVKLADRCFGISLSAFQTGFGK